MKNQKKLLVLLDGSERSMKTVEYVSQVRPFAGMHIVLFHVFSGVPEWYWDMEKEPKNFHEIDQLKAWETQKKKEIEYYMKKARQLLIDAGFSEDSVEITILKRQKGISRDIIEEAKQGYSAVVLRRRGLGEVEGITVGSVGTKLMGGLSFMPIIVAGKKPSNEKFLIAVDGSPSSINAVNFVGDLVGGFGYEVGLFHVIRGTGSILPDMLDFMMPAKNIEAAKNEMMARFRKLKDKLAASGVSPEKISFKVKPGVFSRAEAIVHEAKKEEYGTIVMGRRGLSKVQEFPMGRVTNKVIFTGHKYTIWII